MSGRAAFDKSVAIRVEGVGPESALRSTLVGDDEEGSAAVPFRPRLRISVRGAHGRPQTRATRRGPRAVEGELGRAARDWEEVQREACSCDVEIGPDGEPLSWFQGREDVRGQGRFELRVQEWELETLCVELLVPAAPPTRDLRVLCRADPIALRKLLQGWNEREVALKHSEPGFWAIDSQRAAELPAVSLVLKPRGFGRSGADAEALAAPAAGGDSAVARLPAMPTVRVAELDVAVEEPEMHVVRIPRDAQFWRELREAMKAAPDLAGRRPLVRLSVAQDPDRTGKPPQGALHVNARFVAAFLRQFRAERTIRLEVTDLHMRATFKLWAVPRFWHMLERQCKFRMCLESQEHPRFKNGDEVAVEPDDAALPPARGTVVQELPQKEGSKVILYQVRIDSGPVPRRFRGQDEANPERRAMPTERHPVLTVPNRITSGDQARLALRKWDERDRVLAGTRYSQYRLSRQDWSSILTEWETAEGLGHFRWRQQAESQKRVLGNARAKAGIDFKQMSALVIDCKLMELSREGGVTRVREVGGARGAVEKRWDKTRRVLSLAQHKAPAPAHFGSAVAAARSGSPRQRE